ncbi:MAG: acylphosphatase [Candidatus Omnitrophica bacterium]|jgi:acylphosphatase|nr:acylphosphatase [Candidatus Omnitrophota bacterium]
MKKQLHVYYSGRVQGIGFRYAVQEIAGSLKVSGWVKNLSDGRVEVLAEAEESALSSFLEQVNQRFSRYIKEVNAEWQPAGSQPGELHDFQVSF